MRAGAGCMCGGEGLRAGSICFPAQQEWVLVSQDRGSMKAGNLTPEEQKEVVIKFWSHCQCPLLPLG